MKRKKVDIEAGIRHLQRVDPVMKQLILRCPPLTELRLQEDRFFSLANSILSQQISVHAARAIKARLVERTAPRGVTPDTIAGLDIDELRSIGISRQKASYLTDLAGKVRSGDVALNKLGYLNDEGVIRQLTKIRGIGVWTAQMFLIFSLGRLDVFPSDDYGVRSAVRSLYSLEELPDKATTLEIADQWHPYATIASWYCWRSLDLGTGEGGGPLCQPLSQARSRSA